MFRSTDDFLEAWKQTSAATLKLLEALTDESLARPVAEGHRTLGRIAWHTVLSIGEMAARTGLKLDCPAEDTPVPATAAEIAAAYERASGSLGEAVKKKWNNDILAVEDDMYGMQWPRGLTLFVLANHEIHHRGQMTVLMRQSGLKVPGVFGPAKEEWGAYGKAPPEI